MIFRDRVSGFIAALAAVLLTTSAMAVEGPVLVFGGTSGTGLATVQFLRAQDVAVTVFVRPTSDTSALQPLGVKTVVGDALNPEDVDSAFQSGRFKTVVSSLGGRRGEPRPDLIGNRNINESAKAFGVKRIVQVTAIRGEYTDEVPAEGTFAHIMYLKRLAEDELMASGLDYTIVRPGELHRGEATGTGVLTTEERMGSIDRQEVGRLIVQALDDDVTIGKALNAIDPEFSESDEE